MFTLRDMRSSDGPALQRLLETDPPSSGLSSTTCFRVDPYQAWITLQPSMIGVVAEEPGTDELVGAATMAFDEVQFEGRVLPVAMLENLKVHHAYRQQGLGMSLVQWRIDQARERFGEDGIITSGTTSDNAASIATMRKWSKQVVSSLVLVPRPALRRSPARRDDLTIRPPQPDELAEIAKRSNRFFESYNFYPPLSAEKLTAYLESRVKHYRIAIDKRGVILAGAMLSERGRLMVDEFSHVPRSIRLANMFLRMIPPDNQIRLLEVAFFWFDDLPAARYLWEMIRWQFRAQASTVNAGFDPRGPMPEVLRIKRWHVPKLEIVLAVSAPTPMSDTRLLCSHLRG